MKSMKFSNIILLFVLATSLFACTKESTTPQPAADPRDAFVGTWKGTSNVTIDGDLISEETTFSISKNTTNNTKIIITDRGITIGATVNGNTFTYDQFTITDDDGNGGIITTIFSGSGTINGNNLREEGVVREIYNNTEETGTWLRNSVKQ